MNSSHLTAGYSSNKPVISKTKRGFSRNKLALAIAAQVVLSSQALAAPSGGVVVGGTGVIEQVGKETTITQGTDKLAIDWNSFNVNVDERVQFIQPTQSSIALNRILGTNGSQILGQIDANGHVVLVNPNGIFFGKTASVNAGGLIASGLQINPEDFINGDMVFKGLEGTDGTVINTGLLNASLGGNVTLLGKSVENRGLIVANMGRVNLVAGEQVVLTFDSQGLLGVQVDEAVLQDELNDEATLKNSGEIRAENGQILLSASKAQDVFSQAVNHGGVAKSVVYHDDGSFSLGAGSNVLNTGTITVSGSANTNGAGDVVVLGKNITNSGSILANSQVGTAGNIELHANTTTEIKGTGLVQANATHSGTGGDVKLQGKNIGLFDEANVSASGTSGGGTVLIGGDREGLNFQIKNADFVYIGEDANVKVDAIQSGDGGKLITFAEDTARIYGQLSAIGGAEKGNGGFIETSGKRGFELLQTPNIAAINGRGGHWLIDPYDIDITTTSSSINNNASTLVSPFTSTGEVARLRALIVQNALNLGGDVTVKTGEGDGFETELGNITVSSKINLTTNVESTLNLIAHNSIFINANIEAGQVNGRKLNINLTANAGSTVDTPTTGGVYFDDGVYISTSGGDVTIKGYDVDFNYLGTGTDTGAAINLWGADYFGSGNARYMAPSGSILVNAEHDVVLAAPGNSAIPDNSFVNRQPFLVKGKELAGQLPKVQIVAGNDITFNGWLYDNNANEVFTAPNGTVSETQFDGDGYTTFKLTAGNDIHFKGSLDLAFATRRDLNELDRMHVVLEADSDTTGGGSVLFDSGLVVNTGGGDFTVLGSTNLDLRPLTQLDLASAYGPGSFNVSASGNINIGEIETAYEVDVTNTPNLRVMDFTANAGSDLTLNQNIETFSGDITLTANKLILNGSELNTYTASPFSSKQGNISLTTSSNLVLGTVDALGDFFISANDVLTDDFSVTQSGGSVSVDGKSVFNIGGSDITLRSSVELLGDIQITSAGNANFLITSPNTEAQTALDFNLAASTVSDNFNFSVDGNGNITSTGAIVVGGSSTFSAANNNITLGGQSNDFGGAVFIDNGNNTFANSVSINTTNDLILGNASKTFKINQDLKVTAGGNVTQVGVLDVGGDSEITAGATSAITLNSDNLFGNIAIPRASSASITNSKDLRLGNIASLDSLSVTLKGNSSNLTQSTASTNGLNIDNLTLNVGGTTTLNNTNNDLTQVLGSVNGGTLISAGDLTLGAFTLNSDFAITVLGGAKFAVLADATLTDGKSNTPSNTLSVSTSTLNLIDNFKLDGGLDLAFANVADFNFNSAISKVKSSDNSTISVTGTNNSGSDNFIIGDKAKSGVNAFIINGADGTQDTLTGPDANNVWSIQTLDSKLTLADTTSVITFNGIEKIQGGTAADVFVAGPGATGITLAGGNNTDTTVLDSLTSALGDNQWSLASGTVTNSGGTLNFSQIESLVGGGTLDELTGPNGDPNTITTWQIGNGLGTVGTISFTNMTKVTGGSRNDRFELTADANITTQLDGGSGNNTLVGKDEDTAWNITGGNAGSVAAGALFDAANTYVSSFTNIQNLTGQSKTDNFFFNSESAKLDGLISGGAGTDSINYSQRTDDLDIKLGFNSLDSITGIEQIIGNNKDNSFLTIVDGDSPLINSPTYKNDWTLDNPNAGQVVLTRGDAAATTTITFSQFGNVAGETVVDNFTFTPTGTLTGKVDGDALNSTTTSINSIISPSLASVWTISNTNNVTNVALTSEGINNHLASSSNIQKLVGSAAQDIFNFSTQTPIQIDGGSGLDAGGLEVQDQITFANVKDHVSIVLGGSSGLSVSGVEQVIGNNTGNGAYNSQLNIGASGNSTWQVNEANGGTVTLSGQPAIGFSGFNQLGGGSGNDTFNLSADVVASSVDTTAFIRGNAGTDTFNLNASISALISGDAGNDIFNIKAAGVTAKLDGNANSDTLNAFAGVGHTWTINASDSSVTDIPVNITDPANKITFNGMDVLNGSATEVDIVSFSSVSSAVSVTINAGDTDGIKDVISYASVPTSTAGTVGLGIVGSGMVDSGVVGLNGFELIQGNGGDLVLQGSASATPTNITDWAITKNNAGTVTVDGRITEFEDFAHLRGAAGLDNFTFVGDALVASVDGGQGTNTANLSGRSSGIKIDLSAASSLDNGAQLNLANIATVTANAQFANELMSATDNTWTINSLNSGAVNHGGVSTDFVGFNQLSGKAGVDNFVLGLSGELAVVEDSGTSIIAGTVDGGLGANSLTAADRDNVWTITDNTAGVSRGSVTTNNLALNFSNIQTLVGGSANDTLNATDSVNIWTLDQDFAGDVNGLKFTSMNILMGGNLADQFNVAKNISQGNIFGGNGADTVVLDSGASASSIQMGLGKDSVTLNNATVAGLLDGGAGDDAITFSAYASALAVATESNANANVTVFNFEQINAAAGTGYDLLGLASVNNIWTITDDKSGTLNGIGFSGFDVLQGGSADDEFNFSGAFANASSVDIFGDISGVANSGIDTASYAQVSDNVLVDVNASAKVAGIEVLVGNNNGDIANQYSSEVIVTSSGKNTWLVDQINSGTVSVVDGGATHSVVFKDFNQLSGGSGADTFTFLVDASANADSVADIRGLNASINGGSGADVFNLNSSVTAPIDAGAGNDTFNILASNVSAQINGGANTDTLNAFEGSANYWLVSSDLSLLDNTEIPVNTVITTNTQGLVFEKIETLQGSNSQVDSFGFIQPQVLGTVNAGSGVGIVDVASFAAVPTATTVNVILGDSALSSFEKVVGNGANSFLTGTNSASTWNVLAQNSGEISTTTELTYFENFAHLIGGSADDTFNLSALVASIDGGSGRNTVDAKSLAQDVSVALTQSAAADLNVSNVESVSANGDFKNELISGASNNIWTVDNINTGNVVHDGITTLFSGFNQLTGLLNNEFSVQGEGALVSGGGLSGLAEVAGGVKGGTGSSSLTLKLIADNVWHVKTANGGEVTSEANAKLTAMNFENIQILIGGDQADNFYLDSELSSVVSIDGKQGVNRFSSRNLDSTWQLSRDFGGVVDGLNFYNIQSIKAGDLNDAFVASADVKIGSIDGGLGDNSLNLSSYTTSVNVVLGSEISGDAERQGITIINFDELTAPNREGNRLHGLQDADNSWTIDQNGSGSVGVLSFSHFDTFIGGDLADTFTLSVNNIKASISGGLGLNSLSVLGSADNKWAFNTVASGQLNNVFTFSDIQNITGSSGVDVFDFAAVTDISLGALGDSLLNGGDGNDQLIGFDVENLWEVTGANSGRLNNNVNFESVENLTGGNFADTFYLIENGFVDGIIDGGLQEGVPEGGQADFLDNVRYTGTREINFMESLGDYIGAENGSFNYINIINIEGTGGSAGFFAGNGTNEWVITGENTGTLNGRFEFKDLAALRGGDGSDTFIFMDGGSLTEAVDGGLGDNTLKLGYDNADHTWLVTGKDSGELLKNSTESNSSTVTLFENIQNLVGSNAVDQFLFPEPADGAANTASVVGIDGLGGLDSISLHTQERQQITLNADNSSVVALSGAGDRQVISSIKNVELLDAGAGDDEFVVGGINSLVNIIAGEGNDTLSSAAWTGVDVAINLGAKTLTADNQILNFSDVESFKANVTTLSKIEGYDRAATWTLDSDNSGQVTYANLQSDGDVDSDVSPELFSFVDFQKLVGGNASDDYLLNGYKIGVISGGDGLNTLTASGTVGSKYTWSIDGGNSGSTNVLLSASATPYTYLFDHIAVLTGGEGQDNFDFSQGGSITGWVDGVGGLNDQMSYTSGNGAWNLNGNSLASFGKLSIKDASNTVVTQFANIDVLNAGGKDSLYGANAQNTWNFTESGNSILTVNDNGVETVTTFSGFNHFVGGDNQDTFNVASMPNMKANQAWIDGGGSISDVLNITDPNSGYSVALYGYSADQGGIDLFAINVESLKSVGLNSLWGDSAAGIEYTWQIDAKYHGFVSYGADDAATRIEFSQFDKIFGGDSNDLFQISSNDFMDYIYGGAGLGQDLIDFSQVKADQIIEVNSAGTASGVSGIEGFVGNNDGSENAIYQSTLRVSNQSSNNSSDTNVWTITDINDGTFVQNGRNEITFRNFNHLLGGKGNDEFTIAEGGAITGTIAGAEPSTVGGFDTVAFTGNSAAQVALVLEQDLAAATDYSGVNQARNELRKTASYADLKDYTLVSNIDSVIGNGKNTTLRSGLADTVWQFSGTDRGDFTYNDGGEKKINFDKVANIQGSDRNDHFTFNDTDRLTGWLSGGAGEDHIEFDFSTETPILVAVADMQQTVLQANSLVNIRNDVEEVTANSISTSVNQNTLIGTAASNEWLIDGENSGQVNGVAFGGFDSLTGDAQDDIFTVVGTGRMSGKVDGAEGINSVDASGMTQAFSLTVGLDHPGVTANLQIENIQSVTANADFDNTLIGANAENTWRLEDLNQGYLGEALAFFEFNNLVGGDLKDSFIFSSKGALSGYIDGGLNPASQRDSIDYSQLSGDVQVAVASFVNGKIQNNAQANAQSTSIINIELVKGNSTGLSGAIAKNNSEIIAADFENVWTINDFDDELTITDGVNDGQINFNNTSLAFVDFSTLTGGAKSDTFNQINGVVSGIVNGAAGDDVFNISTQNASSSRYNGGDGNDVFNYTLESSKGNIQTYIDGGNGTDSVFVNGVALDFNASYRAIDPVLDVSVNPYSVAAVLSYQEKIADSVVAQSIEYQNLESFQQGAKISSLTIEGSNSENPDHIELNDGYFAVNDHTPVAYNANTPKITVNASPFDIVSLDQSFSVLDTLTLNSGIISLANPAAVINTTSLVLNAVSAGEDAEGVLLDLLLNTNITNLSINDVKGAVEIVQDSNQANPLILQTISNIGGAMSIRQTNGNVEQSQTAKLDIKGLFSVSTDNGDINLSNPTNHLTGEVALSAKDGNVSLVNDTAIALTGVNADNLTLVAEGSITSIAPVVVRAATTLSSTGDITLTDSGNQLSKLKIEKANDVHINASSVQNLVLDQAEVTGDLNLSTDDLFVSGPIRAQSVNLSATGSLEVGALSGIQSNSTLVLHTGNDLDIKADLQAANDIDISVDDGSYYQAADVSTSQGDVQLHVKNDVYMELDAQIRALAGDVIIEGVSAGEGVGKVSLGQIVANSEEGSNGLIKIISRESVIDNNGSDDITTPNIVANHLVVRTAQGIGVGDAIETQVSSMDVINSNTVFDAIQFDNKGSLDIIALWANGNIGLNNEGDVTVTSGSINAFYDGRPLIDSVNEEISKTLAEGRRREFSKLEPNIIDSSELTMTITGGGLRMKGAVNENNPDIAAYSTQMSIDGDIGDPSDPQLVLYIPQDFSLSADRRWKKLVWAFGLGFPDGLIEENVTPVPTIQAGEQLIAVEELEEVDPAVFTSVKNYYYNEISILLPQDQRYEDEDEE